MKLRPALIALALAATMAPSLPAHAGSSTATLLAAKSQKAPIEGRWRKGKMEVEIRPCGRQTWCATVTDASKGQRERARKGSGVELLGLTMIRDLTPDEAPGTYKGKVFIADKNMTAKGTITAISDTRIKVRGCALIGLVCREREWVRTGR